MVEGKKVLLWSKSKQILCRSLSALEAWSKVDLLDLFATKQIKIKYHI